MKWNQAAVVGAGAWGTSYASLLAGKGMKVTIWAYEEETVQQINQHQENLTFLPGVPLPDTLSASSDLATVIAENRLIIMATPSHVTRGIIQQFKQVVTDDHCFVILTKGIEQDSLKLMSQVYRDEMGYAPAISILSGPNFAKEIALGSPAAAVVACDRRELLEDLQHNLCVKHFRVYPSMDMIGVQVGATIKNVLAIASGVSDGMKLGSNSQATLICRGLAEMKRLGTQLGGNPETFLGLSGVGDLVLTATNQQSRNYSLGYAMGTGMNMEEYLNSRKSVAEGVKNAVSIFRLMNQHQVEMPISHVVYDMIYSGLTPPQALDRLLARQLPKAE